MNGVYEMNYKELNNAFKAINSWYSKKTKVLNIKTRPYNTSFVFSNIINKILSDGGKILYIWCNTEVNNFYIDKQKFYSTMFQGKDYFDFSGNIHFGTVDEIGKIKEEYDLVIIDDVTKFSKVTIEDIRDAVEEIYWRAMKIIVYTCEIAFPIGQKLDLVYLPDAISMIEPRIINTRIRLEEDIPLTLYQYLKWFKETKKRVIIVVPSEEKMNKVYNHYYHTLKIDEIRVVRYIRGQNFQFIKDIIEGYSDCLFIITNYIGEYVNDIEDLNIIVLFADDMFYSYKKFLYLSGALNINNDILPEVLFVSKEISNDMDMAKFMIRMFNKMLWEKKLIRH